MPLTTPSHYIHNRQPVSGGTVKYWAKSRFRFTPVDGSPYPDTAAADYTATTAADGSWTPGTLVPGDYYVSLEATGLVRSWTGDLIAPAAAALSCWPDGTVALPGWPRCTDLDSGLYGIAANQWGLVAGGRLIEQVRLNPSTGMGETHIRSGQQSGIGYSPTLQLDGESNASDFSYLAITDAADHQWTISAGRTGGNMHLYISPEGDIRLAILESLGRFLTIPGKAGVPAGTPANSSSTEVPIVVNVTNKTWYGYIGGSWQVIGVPGGSGGGGALTLDDLTDVAITSPAAAQVPRYNGSLWVNAGLSVDDLSDVAVSSPANGQVLAYNSTNTRFENASAASASNLDSLTDVAIASPTNDQVLVYESASSLWKNKADPGGGATFLGAHVYHSANQSIADNTLTALAFNSERWDTDTIHDPATNNTRLTCKTAGKYQVYGNVEFAANATGLREADIRMNGTTYVSAQNFAGQSADTNKVVVGPMVVDMTVNDYVELIVKQTSGGSLNLNSVGNYSPEFGMYKVG